MFKHFHPMSIIDTAFPKMAWDSVQSIQKHLRLTADQAHLLFYMANSSSYISSVVSQKYYAPPSKCHHFFLYAVEVLGNHLLLEVLF